MSKEFRRTDYMRSLKLGKKRKKARTWRAAKGKHSKMRRKRKGYPIIPEIGYRSPREDRGKINNSVPKLVYNLNDLSSLGKNSVVILARIGAKKKLEVIKKAEEMNIRIINIGGKK